MLFVSVVVGTDLMLPSPDEVLFSASVLPSEVIQVWIGGDQMDLHSEAGDCSQLSLRSLLFPWRKPLDEVS